MLLSRSHRILPRYHSLVTASRSSIASNSRISSQHVRSTSYTESPQSQRLTRGFRNATPYALPQTPSDKSFEMEKPPNLPPPTDFEQMNIFGNVPQPQTAVDSCLQNGFILTDETRVEGSGIIFAGGQAFRWSPWLTGNGSGEKKQLLNASGQWEVQKDAFGIFGLLWPKPDLLILGTGKKMEFLSAPTRKAIHEMGIRVEVMDTRNAAAQYNLLVTERGANEVAAALIPLGWS